MFNLLAYRSWIYIKSISDVLLTVWTTYTVPSLAANKSDNVIMFKLNFSPVLMTMALPLFIKQLVKVMFSVWRCYYKLELVWTNKIVEETHHWIYQNFGDIENVQGEW